MPIPFALLPEHIRLASVQKQSFDDFLNFHVCSREAYGIANKVKTRFSVLRPVVLFGLQKIGNGNKLAMRFRENWYLADRCREILVRFDVIWTQIYESITTEFCQLLTEFVLTTNSTSAMLELKSVDCSPELWDRLLDPLKVQTFICCNPISPELLLVPAMKTVTNLTVKSPLNNDEFLRLQMPSMDANKTNVTSVGINLFLNEWMNGTRNIDYVKIEISSELQKDVIFRGIPNEHSTNSYLLKREKDEKVVTNFFDFEVNEIIIYIQI